MKLSAQEEYGLRCLLHIAQKGPDSGSTLQELSEAEALGLANVAKMMRILRQAGFVKSTRGQAGGYALARPAQRIMISDVLATLGGRLFDSTYCDRHARSDDGSCHRASDCSVRSLWRLLQSAVDQALVGITLQDLVQSESSLMSALRRLRQVPQPQQRLPGTG